MKEAHEKIYRYIVGYIKGHGYSPSVQEIADGSGFASKSTVFNHLIAMREAGLINYVDHIPRTITLPGYRYVKTTERRRDTDGREWTGSGNHSARKRIAGKES